MNELETTRAKLKCLEMVEGTGLDWWKCVKHQGCVLSRYPSYFVADEKEYEFALRVVEGKPVWEGDRLYDEDGYNYIASPDIFNGTFRTLSWNPPKSATFNKFCFTADITPSTEHLDIWKAACEYQREQDAKLFDGITLTITTPSGGEIDLPEVREYIAKTIRANKGE